MMSTVIIEDDPISAELLHGHLKELDDDFEIIAILGSVREGISFLKSQAKVDLVFADIQLSDGLSFEIFETVTVTCPIIFISAYDKYIVNSFEFSGIDYLVKPVSRDSLEQSIRKYKKLEKHFLTSNIALKGFLQEYLSPKRTRIIVKKGVTNVSLALTDIVLFYTESLVVYAIDSKGSKFIVDKSLNQLEKELDTRQFFRANRQYIVNLHFIQGYKTYERVKLMVSLTLKELDHLIIVGQEKARAFKSWLSEA